MPLRICAHLMLSYYTHHMELERTLMRLDILPYSVWNGGMKRSLSLDIKVAAEIVSMSNVSSP